MNVETEKAIVSSLKTLLVEEPNILSRIAAKQLGIPHTTLNKILKVHTGMTFQNFRVMACLKLHAE